MIQFGSNKIPRDGNAQPDQVPWITNDSAPRDKIFVIEIIAKP